MRGKYTIIDKDVLSKTYEDNKRSLRAAGKALGVSDKTVMRHMIKNNLKWDKKILYSCNENFFDDLNEQSLYWLGFLSADGNVYKHKYSYSVNLRIALKDLEHLKKFKDHIGFTGPIHYGTHKGANGF
jgi:hypothetical protein